MKTNILLLFILISLFSSAQNLKPFKHDNGLWGYKDTDGYTRIDAKYKEAENFYDGLAAVLDVKKEKWTFINEQGDYMFEPRFKYKPKSFENGLAIVIGDFTKSALYYGVINKRGDYIIPAKYDMVSGPCKGVYHLRNENKLKYDIRDDTHGLALTNGTILSEPVFEGAESCPDDNGWIKVTLNGRNKYQHIDGRLSDAPAKINYSGVPKKDYFIKQDKLVNLITGSETSIPLGSTFVNDYYIAISGDTLIYPTPEGYNYLKSEDGEYLNARNSQDKKELIIGHPEFYLAHVKITEYNFERTYLLYQNNSAVKLSDKFISPIFRSKYFSVLVGKSQIKQDSVFYAIIDNKGNILGNNIHDYKVLADETTIVYSKNDSIFFYDGQNHKVIATYVSAFPAVFYSSSVKLQNIDWFPVKAGSNSINFIRIDNREVALSDISGTNALPFVKDKAAILRDTLWGAIDRNNNTVVPFEYTKISESVHYNMLLLCGGNKKDCFDFLEVPKKPNSPEDNVTIYVKYTFWGQKYSDFDPVYFATVLTKQKFVDNSEVQKFTDEQALKWLTTEGKNYYHNTYYKVEGDAKNFEEVWQRKHVSIESEKQYLDFRDQVRQRPSLGAAVIISYY